MPDPVPPDQPREELPADIDWQDPDDVQAHAREAWHDLWTSEPFGIVLVLVFATFIFIESAPDDRWVWIVTIALQGATLLMAMRAAQNKRRYRHAARALVGIGLVCSTILVIGGDRELSQSFVRIVSVILVAVTPFTLARSVLHSIFTQKRVTLQSIFGVVAIYILIGMLFAYSFSAIGAVSHDPFFSPTSDVQNAAAPPTNGSDENVPAEDIQNYVYFSFVTMTTVGYGDLTADTQLGRSLAIVEALLGQLYLITVLSVFVGNLRTRTPREMQPGQDVTEPE